MVVGDQRAEFAQTVGDLVEHGPRPDERDVLVEAGDPHAGRAPDRAAHRAATSPAITFSRLDLPEPLRPMSAIRSPASIWRQACSNSGRWPKARDRLSMVSRGKGNYE